MMVNKKIFLTLGIISLVIISFVVTDHAFNVRDISCSFCDLDCLDIDLSTKDPKDMGIKDWLEDFRSLYSFVKENYPYLQLKERMHGYNWLDLKNQYEDRIRTASNNEEFLSILLDAVQALQNRHTLIIDPNEVHDYHKSFSNTYPLCEIFCYEVYRASKYWEEIYQNSYERKYRNRYETFIVYEKGHYILAEDTESCSTYFPKGSKVISVNNIPIDDAVKASYEQDYIDWDFHRNKSYIWMISPRNFGNNAKFSIQIEEDIYENISFSCFTGDSLFPYNYHEQILNFDTWETESTAYMKVSSFDSQLYQYSKAIERFYKQLGNYDNFILDIRGNEGGYYSYWVDLIVNPLIQEEEVLEQYLAHRCTPYTDCFHKAFGLYEEISTDCFECLPPELYTDNYQILNFSFSFEPKGENSYNGDIYLLTDNVVYSSAESFAHFCKQTGFATIIGTPTGGDGMMVCPLYYVLPNSKLVIQMSSALGLCKCGKANEEARTQPDILYESSFGDYQELIEYVLDYIKQS